MKGISKSRHYKLLLLLSQVEHLSFLNESVDRDAVSGCQQRLDALYEGYEIRLKELETHIKQYESEARAARASYIKQPVRKLLGTQKVAPEILSEWIKLVNSLAR